MKYILFIIFLVIGITACSGDRYNCSWDGEVCVELRVEEPVLRGETVAVIITVTTTTDIPGLKMNLNSYPHVLIEDGEYWKEGVNWVFDAQANQTYVFTRYIHFPPEWDLYQLDAGAYKSYLDYIQDSFYVLFSGEGGVVYYAGTPIPTRSGPLPTTDPDTLATLRAMSSPTPWPILTPYPTNTAEITSTPYPPPLPPSWEMTYP